MQKLLSVKYFAKETGENENIALYFVIFWDMISMTCLDFYCKLYFDGNLKFIWCGFGNLLNLLRWCFSSSNQRRLKSSPSPCVLLAIQGTGGDHLPLTHQWFIWTGSSDTEIQTPMISIPISVREVWTLTVISTSTPDIQPWPGL